MIDPQDPPRATATRHVASGAARGSLWRALVVAVAYVLTGLILRIVSVASLVVLVPFLVLVMLWSAVRYGSPFGPLPGSRR